MILNVPVALKDCIFLVCRLSGISVSFYLFTERPFNSRYVTRQSRRKVLIFSCCWNHWFFFYSTGVISSLLKRDIYRFY